MPNILENEVKEDEQFLSNPLQGSGNLLINPKIVAPNLKIAPSTVEVVERNTGIYVAGEAIDASINPQAVYKDTTAGQLFLTQASSSGKRRFFGFVSNKQVLVAGQNCEAIIEGYVGGFSSLTNGQFVYLSDTAGAISHTPSTTAIIRVGVAVSATQVLIIGGANKSIFGSSSFSGTATTTVTATTGFRVKSVSTSSKVTGAGGVGLNRTGAGFWSDSSGQGYCGSDDNGVVFVDTGKIIVSAGTTNTVTVTISNNTETGFDIVFTVANGSATVSSTVVYLAMGE